MNFQLSRAEMLLSLGLLHQIQWRDTVWLHQPMALHITTPSCGSRRQFTQPATQTTGLFNLFLHLKLLVTGCVNPSGDETRTNPWRLIDFGFTPIATDQFTYPRDSTQMCYVTSDVHIDLFHDSWFTWIQQNSCRCDSIQLIYDEPSKGIKITILKSGEQQ